MTTVLFADRDGSAFGPLAPRIVPALLPLAGVPLLERALEALVAAGIRVALLVVGPARRRDRAPLRQGNPLGHRARDRPARGRGERGRRPPPARAPPRRRDGRRPRRRRRPRGHRRVPPRRWRRRAARSWRRRSGGRPAGIWRLLPGALKKKDFPREPGLARLDARPGPRGAAARRPRPASSTPWRPTGARTPRTPDGRTAFAERAQVDGGAKLEGVDDGRRGGRRPRGRAPRGDERPPEDRDSARRLARERGRLGQPRRRRGDGRREPPDGPAAAAAAGRRTGAAASLGFRPRALAPALARRGRLERDRERGPRDAAP